MPDVPFSLLIPVAWPYVVSSHFNDPRRYAFAPHRLQLHEGIDFAPNKVKDNLLVRAAQRGIVDKVGFDSKGYGNYVRIVHDWGNQRYVTWYGHLSKALVQQNDYLATGQTLGIAGSTGNSTGTHVHLTLQHIGHGFKNYVVDDVIDPEPFLTEQITPFDELWWVGDVTIPDNTLVDPGQRFHKTWRIRNAGTTHWKNYRLAFSKNLQMSGPEHIPLPEAAPGDVVDVSLDLVAPVASGIQRSTWEAINADGLPFDYELYTEVTVKPAPTPGVNEARYMEDVTIADGAAMKPGQAFRKTWRIRNDGTSVWGEGYALGFFGEEQMGGSESVPLPSAKPSDEVDVSVDLIAPTAPGLHRGVWRPRDPQGDEFDFAVYVEINVIVQSPVDAAQFVQDVILLHPGETFVKTWRVHNSGKTRWGDGYTLAFLAGDPLGAPASLMAPAAKSGETVDVSVRFAAPKRLGVYTSTWQLHSPDGIPFGPTLVTQIEVQA